MPRIPHTECSMCRWQIAAVAVAARWWNGWCYSRTTRRPDVRRDIRFCTRCELASRSDRSRRLRQSLTPILERRRPRPNVDRPPRRSLARETRFARRRRVRVATVRRARYIPSYSFPSQLCSDHPVSGLVRRPDREVPRWRKTWVPMARCLCLFPLSTWDSDETPDPNSRDRWDSPVFSVKPCKTVSWKKRRASTDAPEPGPILDLKIWTNRDNCRRKPTSATLERCTCRWRSTRIDRSTDWRARARDGRKILATVHRNQDPPRDRISQRACPSADPSSRQPLYEWMRPPEDAPVLCVICVFNYKKHYSSIWKTFHTKERRLSCTSYFNFPGPWPKPLLSSFL